jgi:hypothetical protein
LVSSSESITYPQIGGLLKKGNKRARQNNDEGTPIHSRLTKTPPTLDIAIRCAYVLIDTLDSEASPGANIGLIHHTFSNWIWRSLMEKFQKEFPGAPETTSTNQ